MSADNIDDRDNSSAFNWLKHEAHKENETVGNIDAKDLREQVIARLKEIFDPEIPVNIYDLGLIYGVEVSNDGLVDITMTLTTPGCPVAATFPGEIEATVADISGVKDCMVELVWDPPWTVDMLTDEIKLDLGLL